MSDETRAALRSANERVCNLTREIERLEAAAQRAEQTVQDATADLEKYEGLDKEITKWRVEQAKQGAGTKVLPETLKAQVDGKRDAVEELEQARATQKAIQLELDDLRQQLRPAELERVRCAVAILHEMGDALASELATMNRRRAELFQLLIGLERLEVSQDGEWPRAIGLTEYSRNAMTIGETDVFPHGAEATREMADRWKRRLDTICTNPEAEIQAPKNLAPSDYVPEPAPGSWIPEFAGTA